MTDAVLLVELWEDVVENILDYYEPEEIEGGLIRRDSVKDVISSLSPEFRHRLDAADREFIRIRPQLVERFPGEFNPKYWNATEDEWWWWPDRMPADLAHTRS